MAISVTKEALEVHDSVSEEHRATSSYLPRYTKVLLLRAALTMERGNAPMVGVSIPSSVPNFTANTLAPVTVPNYSREVTIRGSFLTEERNYTSVFVYRCRQSASRIG